MARVLKPEGSIFVNLGDKYCNYQGPHYGQGRSLDGPRGPQKIPDGGPIDAPGQWGVPNKSLIGLPWRYALACIDELGLILRKDIIWHKPNPLPTSAKDRVGDSHEYLFHLVRQPRYYAAVDELREPYASASLDRDHYGYGSSHFQARNGPGAVIDGGRNPYQGTANPAGRLPGSVWTIATEPLRLPDHLGVQHYAAFPSELPRRLILGWSPDGICLDCGQGRFPVVDRRYDPEGRTTNGPRSMERRHLPDGTAGFPVRQVATSTIVGHACACTPSTWHSGDGEPSPTAQANGKQAVRPHDIGAQHYRVGPWREYHLDRWTPPPTRPAVALDAFGGIGTTAMVARALGRIAISIDLSEPYCRAARWRIAHSRGADKAIARTNQERQQTLELLQ